MNNISKTHAWIQEHIEPHFHCIDLTCGNGHDTKLLAQLCNHVIAVDIQPQAIENTKKRLKDFNNVEYIMKDHSKLNFEEYSPINGAIYNLGYLPHGDKSLITKTESTIKSLNALLPHLTDFLVITCYPGHEGGDVEAEAVKAWIEAHNLNPTIYSYPTENSPIAYCLALGGQ